MLWADFYDNHWDWADSTKRTRISSLEDIGSGEEVLEVLYEIDDPKIKAQLIRKAIKLGAEFTPDDMVELEGELPAELFEQLLQYSGLDSTYPYTDEDNMSWDDFYCYCADWDSETLARRIQKLNDFGPSEEIVDAIQWMPTSELEDLLYQKALAAGIKFSEEEKMAMKDFGEIICDTVNAMPSDEEIKQLSKNAQSICKQIDTAQKPPKPKRPGLLGILAALFIGSGHKKTSHYCDGNCATCPPHYGYRYGRWYYGHGHQWGCQRGGNGGASGRTYRD